MIAQRTLVLAFLSLLLAACGGDGGGGGSNGGTPPTTTPPPGGGTPNTPPLLPEPTDWDQYSAEHAQVRMMSIETALSITWFDLFENEQGFRVERRVGEGDWELVEALPPMTGGMGIWSRTVPVAARYRMTVVLEGRTIPLHSPGNETEIAIDPAPANPPTIQVDQSEPIRGAVQVSVQNAEPAVAVRYALEGAQFARVTGGGTFSATLPAQQLVDGQRRLQVYIEKSPGLLVSRIRSLQVDNPAPAVAFYAAVQGPSLEGPLRLTARASSDAGITGVEFFINGASVHVANTPFAGTDQYIFNVDRSTLPLGANVFRVVATDSTTATAAMELTYTLDEAPTLNVTGLFDGMIASGNSVRISGNFSDDAAGANLTIDAGDLRVLRTLNSPFAVDFSLAGVPPGEHSVNIRVQDSLGRITSRYYSIIVPSTSLNYELLARDAEQLLAADGGSLLYRKSSGAVVLRNAAGAETTFPAATFGGTNYRMSEGRIVAFGNDQRIYALDATGQATNISPDGPAFSEPIWPIVRGPWVAWRPINAPEVLKLYNLHTGASRDIPIAPTFSGINYDVVTTPGNEQVLFESNLNGTTGIYSHNLATNARQLIVSGAVGGPRSDGTRLVWSDVTSPPIRLFIAPLSNPAAATLLSTGTRARTLEGGLMCWIDQNGTMYVNDGSVTTELSTQLTPSIGEYTVEDGRIVFPENDQMHVWSAANGERVWLDTVPTATVQADGVAYFLTGSSGTLYRVALP